MRERIEQKKKADGPLGIRTGVWLIVFGSVLVCVLMIGLSHRHTNLPAGDTWSEGLPDQDSSTRRASFRRTPHREIAPANQESGASYDMDEAQLAIVEQMTQDRRTWIDYED